MIQIPADRYTSAAYAERELADMWPKVWVVACTLDHVAEAGDVFEHRVGPYSTLVVRGDDGVLRAFQNTCRHRGNSLCSGPASGLTELRCGFHRWAWDLQGRLNEVPSRKSFGVLRNEDFALVPAQVDTWGPLVFVNLDPAAPPLADYLEGVPADIDWIGFDDFRCVATVATPVEANWKVVVDGFSETYHLQGLHPEMLPSVDDVNIPQRLWDHVAACWQDYGVPSPRLRGPVSDEAVWESFVLTQGARVGLDTPDELAPPGNGETVRDVIAGRIRAHNAARGVDLSRFDTSQMLRMSQYNLFPNTTVTVFPDLLGVLTARPGPTPDQAEVVLLHFERAAGPDAPRARAVDITMAPGDTAGLGLVLDQDAGVVAGIQRGLRQPGCTHITLSDDECRIVNTHRNLDRYLGAPS